MELNKAWCTFKEMYDIKDNQERPNVLGRDAFIFAAAVNGFDDNQIAAAVNRKRSSVTHSRGRHTTNSSMLHRSSTYKMYNTLFDMAKEIIKGNDVSQISVSDYLALSEEVKVLKSEISRLNRIIVSKNRQMNRHGIYQPYRKEVVQLTSDGVFVNQFKSITEAAKAIGFNHPSAVSGVLHGRSKTAGGYKFEFAE